MIFGACDNLLLNSEYMPKVLGSSSSSIKISKTIIFLIRDKRNGGGGGQVHLNAYDENVQRILTSLRLIAMGKIVLNLYNPLLSDCINCPSSWNFCFIQSVHQVCFIC